MVRASEGVKPPSCSNVWTCRKAREERNVREKSQETATKDGDKMERGEVTAGRPATASHHQSGFACVVTVVYLKLGPSTQRPIASASFGV